MTTGPHGKTVFPASLLLEGRPCLVVGGGAIALRKVNLLRVARAAVTVVAAEASAELRALAAAGAVMLRERPFSPAELDGTVLVFVATNDRALNQEIVACCRERRILCCAVDKGWTLGDFVTPAVFRKDSLTVAVSTGGQSCRRSRLIKNSLARHVEMLESAELLVLGTSHHYLSIEERSPFHLTEKTLMPRGAMLMQVWGIHEFMLLNTCNRVELLAVVTADQAADLLLERVMGFDHLPADRYYVKRGAEAFAHLAFTIAGLLSQTPGEKNIAGQVKTAHDTALAAGWSGGMTQEWLSAALHIGKHIRGQTEPLLAGEEIEDLCLGYLLAECPALQDRRILVLGSGAVGRGCVERLLGQGCQCDWLYHANRPELPAEWLGRVDLASFNALHERLGRAEIVIGATASPGYVLHPGHLPFLDQEKEIRMVDLAVPRNIAPELDGMTARVAIADLDELKRWRQRRQAGSLAQVFEIGNAIVREHQDLYEKLVRSFRGGNARQ